MPKNNYTKWFDYDRIIGSVCFRRVMSKDTICIGNSHSKKLNRYCIDKKIPREHRESLMVLADDYQVLWIVGDRISDQYKVTSETKRILEITIIFQ